MAIRHIKSDFKSLSTSVWDNWGGAQCTAFDNKLIITTTTTAAYYGVEAKDWGTLANSEVFIQMVDAGNTSLASYEIIPIELIITTTANQLGWYFSGGNVLALQKVSSVQTTHYTAAYNSSVHKWFKIRESGGTTYWDYSTDGETWINVASVATPIDVSILKLNIVAGCYAIEATTTSAKFANLNMLPQQIKPTKVRPRPFAPGRAK